MGRAGPHCIRATRRFVVAPEAPRGTQGDVGRKPERAAGSLVAGADSHSRETIRTSFAQAVLVLRATGIAKQDAPRITEGLLCVARNANAALQTRVDALAAAPVIGALEPEILGLLLESLKSRKACVVFRTALASVLSRAKLSREQLIALGRTDRDGRTARNFEAPSGLRGVERRGIGLELVAALRASPGARVRAARRAAPGLSQFPASVQREGAEILKALDVDPEAKGAPR